MRWSTAAKQDARQISTEFDGNLREIADCLAQHENAASVSVPHVHRAFEALASVGLRRRRWIDRPDAETAFGGTLIGASFASPGVVECLCDDPGKGISRGALIALFVVGAFLFAHGTYRGTLPRTVGSERSAWRWIRRTIMGLAIVVAVLVLARLAYQQFAQRAPEKAVPEDVNGDLPRPRERSQSD